MFLHFGTNKYKHKPNKAIAALFSVVFFILLFSCNEKKEQRNIERSFYFWRSVFRLNHFEEQQLQQLQVKTLYVKFFDVDWDETGRKPLPVAELQNTGYTLPPGILVIPTVFITNECIQQVDSSQLFSLAGNITTMVKTIYTINHFADPIPEIQIDCDWTVLTKEKYFTLLSMIKQKSNTTISATIRLHQVKFISKTGVPPVDKGLLMCYNMGNLKNPATKNSILEVEELKKYTGNLSAYPLPLDIALPVFEWKVLFRQNQYKGLLQGLHDSSFTNSCCSKIANRFIMLKDTSMQGYEFFKGDIIRKEDSPYDEIIKTLDEVGHHLKNTRVRVVLYHLDSLLLSKYSSHELENIYSRLR
jgi:hypothetical protein